MERILQLLDAEWKELATSPEGRRALIRWTTDHDVLVGLHDLHRSRVRSRSRELAATPPARQMALAPTD